MEEYVLYYKIIWLVEAMIIIAFYWTIKNEKLNAS